MKTKTKWVLFNVDVRRSPGFDCRTRSRSFSFLRSLGGLSDKNNTSLSTTPYAGKSASYLQKVGRLPWALRFRMPVRLNVTIRPYILKPKQSQTNNLFKIKRETASIKSMFYLHISRAILRIYWYVNAASFTFVFRNLDTAQSMVHAYSAWTSFISKFIYRQLKKSHLQSWNCLENS